MSRLSISLEEIKKAERQHRAEIAAGLVWDVLTLAVTAAFLATLFAWLPEIMMEIPNV